MPFLRELLKVISYSEVLSKYAKNLGFGKKKWNLEFAITDSAVCCFVYRDSPKESISTHVDLTSNQQKKKVSKTYNALHN